MTTPFSQTIVRDTFVRANSGTLGADVASVNFTGTVIPPAVVAGDGPMVNQIFPGLAPGLDGTNAHRGSLSRPQG